MLEIREVAKTLPSNLQKALASKILIAPLADHLMT